LDVNVSRGEGVNSSWRSNENSKLRFSRDNPFFLSMNTFNGQKNLKTAKFDAFDEQ
jgi:hypothetical protein